MRSKMGGNFWRLNLTQFLSATNDNILKMTAVFTLIGLHGDTEPGMVTAAVGAAFVVPFLLFGAASGSLADHFCKARVIRWVKMAEIAISAIFFIALASSCEAAIYLAVVLMGVHSATFSPVKYGSIPEVVAEAQLPMANGLVESFTFMAIIIGTLAASGMNELLGAGSVVPGVVSLVLAVAGVVPAWGITTLPAGDSGRRLRWLPVAVLRTLGCYRGDRRLMLAIFGQAFFMFVAAFVQLNIIGYAMDELALSEAQGGLLFLAAAVGIAVGSLAAARLSRGRAEFGLVLPGLAGMALLPLLIRLSPDHLTVSICLIIAYGFMAGLYSLPLQTFIQIDVPQGHRGEVLAATTMCCWVGILAASGLTYVLTMVFGIGAENGLAVVGAGTALLGAVLAGRNRGLCADMCRLVGGTSHREPDEVRRG